MATIRPIEGRSIHQIQSGQVIVDLCSVVKELVENSLDAGATSIDIRFKNHGLDSIEVQDNGKGIAPEDFETIALKHYTSKLASYEDLTSLTTFGFRGEALSSLCALSKFCIVTARSEDGAVGKKLDFDVSGKLTGTSIVAAQKGTTVAVENLFHSLPVRRKELEKNAKREYGKVLQHLQAYACISVGVRFSVSNQMPKGKRVAVFSTKANPTTKENITNVFGAKTVLALVKLDLHLEMEPSRGPSTQSGRNWTSQASDWSTQVHIQGHISRPVFGEGRQAPDRQMFFVNSRPCGLPQVSKAVNEVYKSFNVSQSPFIFANLVMDTSSYDVNVSPDKRSIMLHDQTALLESLKTALTELFEQTEHTVPLSQLPNRKLPSYKPLALPRRSTTEESKGSVDQDDEEMLGDDGSSLGDDAGNNKSCKEMSNGDSKSLIERWTGRDVEARPSAKTPKSRGDSISKDKQKLVETMQRTYGNEDRDSNADDQSETKEGNIPASLEPDPLSTPFDDLFSQRPQQVPRPVQDFNALTDRKFAPQSQFTSASGQRAHDPNPKVGDQPQPEIPTITASSQKASPGPVQGAFDRMRPKRTPLQIAEITVGDKTVTTTIGSDPPYKKRRLHEPVDSQAIARFSGSPRLARGLRGFAAPGSRIDVGSEADLPVREAEDSESEERASDFRRNDSWEDRGEVSSGAPSRRRVEVDDNGAEVDEERTPDSSGTSTCAPVDGIEPDDSHDEDYLDEKEQKIKEDEKVARLIQEAELAAAQPTEQSLRRASQVLKNGGKRKDSTLQLTTILETSVTEIEKQFELLRYGPDASVQAVGNSKRCGNAIVKDELDDTNAESRLSLTVSKADFERMIIVGQFNLGFILALRPASNPEGEDDLFIIDQHAADEKYNYERLQQTVTLESQRLVHPKSLDLTAVEEETILHHADALKANGFEFETVSPTATVDIESEPASRRSFRLLTLPLAGAKTFDLSDLDELLHLLSELSAGSAEVPRPRKVQRMLAMRACRSSIMVGRTLTAKQMRRVVRQMGDMDKPWNCPHGRPTMRHLAGLGAWVPWRERQGLGGEDGDVDGDGVAEEGRRCTNWGAWLEGRK